MAVGVLTRLGKRAKAALCRPAPLTAAELITSFESLGDNCEFGTIQRLCGAEPQGLFRFNASSIDNMIDVIGTQAARLYNEGDTELFVYDGHDEYMVKSRHYGDFVFHTQVSPNAVDGTSFAGKTNRRLEYLKGKLQEDLQSAEKVFVRKGQENAETIIRLRDMLRRFGPNSLLWVMEATLEHPPGTFEILGEGLYRGYVSKFKDFAKRDPADLASWVTICRSAHRQHSLDRHARSPSPTRPSPRYETSRSVTKGNAWMFGPAFDVSVCNDVSQARPAGTVRGATFTRSCNHDEIFALVDIKHRVRPQTMIVFSAWVWSASDAPPAIIEACFLNFPGLHCQAYDFARLGQWQRIWASADVPRGVSNAVVALRAGGAEGSRIRLGSWLLEEGAVPSQAPTPSHRLLRMPVTWRGSPRLHKAHQR